MIRVILITLMLGLVACVSNQTENPDAAIKASVVGTYFGLLPCADCRGIETNIFLDASGSYEKSIRYLGKGQETKYEDGTWEIIDSQLVLTYNDQVKRYLIGDQQITQLNTAGEVIQGDLADKYQLRKKN